MSRSSKIFWGALVLGAGALFFAFGFGMIFDLPEDVMFRSEESRTVSGGDVFNKIRFVRSAGRDVWLMNQSHDGKKTFDRLAIVVDGRRSIFYQLEPGALEWNEATAQREYKVSCALCHANGPRAIRSQDSLSFRDSLRVALWNLKIKRYPRLEQVAAAFENRKLPFAFEGAFANSPLKVAVCVYCHREDGPIARGTLRRQNALTIARMVENGNMPPLGIPLPALQKRELERFLNGF